MRSAKVREGPFRIQNRPPLSAKVRHQRPWHAGVAVTVAVIPAVKLRTCRRDRRFESAPTTYRTGPPIFEVVAGSSMESRRAGSVCQCAPTKGQPLPTVAAAARSVQFYGVTVVVKTSVRLAGCPSLT